MAEIMADQPTAAEVRRFKAFWGDKADKKLEAYMEYRKQSLAPSPTAPTARYGDGSVPPWMLMLTEKDSEDIVRCKTTGSRITYIHGGYYDVDVPVEDYMSAVSHFFDSNLPRDTEDTLTFIIDCRAGNGPLFKNPPVTSLISMFQSFSNIYQEFFPGRIDNIIVVPMPYFAHMIWNGFSYLLAEDLTKTLIFVSGTSDPDTPLPEELEEYVDVAKCPVIAKSPPSAAEAPGIASTFSSWLGMS